MNKAFLIALKEYGEKGIEGQRNNPKIVKYFQEAGFSGVSDDDVAWCAAFVNWVLLKAGLKGTASMRARSFLKFGEDTKTPQIGDVVVLWRNREDGPSGHVGFFLKDTPKSVFILGGNQDNAVNIKEFSKEQLLGYRKY